MTVKQLVTTACAYADIKPAELARRLGWSAQNLNKRLTTGKLSIEEWESIAEALGAKLNLGFTFPDGKEI